ncbi:MAG: hypothetical protein HYY81_05380 [Deltaproteobacteria bacterium]|nr:hypothetical protein [Deltaproteobacteria bacterium]
MPNLVLFFIIILIAFLAASEGHAQTKVNIAHAAMSARVAPLRSDCPARTPMTISRRFCSILLFYSC